MEKVARLSINARECRRMHALNQRWQQSYTDITSPVPRPPKFLPKKGGILLLKGDPRSLYKSIMPVLLGRDLNIGGLCTGEVISV